MIMRAATSGLFLLVCTFVLCTTAYSQKKTSVIQCPGETYYFKFKIIPDTTVLAGTVLHLDVWDSLSHLGFPRTDSIYYPGSWYDTLGFQKQYSYKVDYTASHSVALHFTASRLDVMDIFIYEGTANITVVDSSFLQLPDTLYVCKNIATPMPAKVDSSAQVEWSPSDGLSNPVSATPNVTLDHNLMYTLRARYGAISLQRNIAVQILPEPVITAPDTVSYCMDEETHIPVSGGVAYDWAPFRGLDDPHSNSPRLSATEPTVYTVQVHGENGCSSTKSIVVLPHPLTTVSCTPEQTLFSKGDSLHLKVYITSDLDAGSSLHGTWFVSATGISSSARLNTSTNEYEVPFNFSDLQAMNVSTWSFDCLSSPEAPDTIRFRVALAPDDQARQCARIAQSEFYCTLQTSAPSAPTTELRLESVQELDKEIEVEVRSPEAGAHSIDIVDQNGVCLVHSNLSDFSSQQVTSHILHFQAGVIRPGWYMVVFRSPSRVCTKPMLVIP